jgi:hypothetical protein
LVKLNAQFANGQGVLISKDFCSMPERARVATGLDRSGVQKNVVFNGQTTP